MVTVSLSYNDYLIIKDTLEAVRCGRDAFAAAIKGAERAHGVAETAVGTEEHDSVCVRAGEAFDAFCYAVEAPER